MATIATRSVSVTFSYPYFKLVFIDTSAPRHLEIDNDPGTVVQGELTLDVTNDLGFDAAGVIVTNSTKLWVEGAEFLTIWRRYTDL